jgi:branched-chain amino acid aminotransferase
MSSSTVGGPLPVRPVAVATSADPASEFGAALTSHMVTATWSEQKGWTAPILAARRPVPLDLSAVGLHYGQIVFEGLKAHRQADGGVAIFRPHAHAARMRQSAARLMMPEPTDDLFIRALRLLVGQDAHFLSDDPSLSLYLRPLLLATEPTLALRPAKHYLFAVLAFCTRGFFASGQQPVSVWVSSSYVRAAPGGTGAVKYAGNYAPAFLAQAEAAQHQCQQVVWLDAIERRWVEEMGGMNLLFVRRGDREGHVVITTPPLASGTLLPGVTRASLLSLASDLGYEARESPITIDEWRDGCRQGWISETIACGTAAIVTPIGMVRTESDEWIIGHGQAGPVAQRLWTALRSLQRGVEPDPHRWLYHIDC